MSGDLAATSEASIEKAAALLQEAVFSSRARQAASHALERLSADARVALEGARAPRGQCGLGERAAVDLDLSERGVALHRELWPAGVDSAALERQRERIAAWVLRQDAFDRERNHFLKAFRQAHGMDRRLYSAELSAAYEAGLAEIYGRAGLEQRAAAAALLEVSAGPH